MTASLQNAYGRQVSHCKRKTSRLILNTNPLNLLATLLGDPQTLNANPMTFEPAFPYVGETAGSDRVDTDLGEIARNNVR